MKAESFSLSDLVEISGAKRRSLQLWADAGVIKAARSTDRAGTGVHRQYSRDEAIIACIIHGFALRQISIGELLAISEAVRAMIFTSSHAGLKKLEGFLVYETWFEHGERRQRCGIGPKISPLHLGRPDSMMMVISLETYLSRLE
ncbi:hypothetical protein ACVWZ4_006138 [Bradyrhizobium sp. USDA 4472]